MSPTIKKRINLHTLGPSNTNCENAARHWAKSTGNDVNITLHSRLETAISVMKDEPGESYLLGCAVYPDLHEIVFNNLDWLIFDDSFVIPTLEMVLATRQDLTLADINTVYTHPAPASLVNDYQIFLASSNSSAAKHCSDGESDGCMTTITSVLAHNLKVLKSFGEINMCFTIHKKREMATADEQY